MLIVHGGDGTVNEVVNGILGQAGPSGPAPAVGVVPGGSANVFARALGISPDPIEAWKILTGPSPRSENCW